MDADSRYFSSAYFGSIPYFEAICRFPHPCIDEGERFQKQSQRSRTTILGSNGILHLSVPVIRPFGQETSMKDVQISYAEDWQKDHWKSLESAYRHAPYFEDYSSEIKDLIHSKEELLVTLNRKTLAWIIEKLDLPISPVFHCDCEPIQHTSEARVYFNQKTLNLPAQSYMQVFSDKFDFIPHLSILDLLLNEGPMARNFLL